MLGAHSSAMMLFPRGALGTSMRVLQRSRKSTALVYAAMHTTARHSTCPLAQIVTRHAQRCATRT